MESNDLEYHLENCMVTGLRAVFMEDRRFRYNPDDTTTDVIITSAYPDLDVDFKIPQVVFTDSSFSFSETSLSNNFESDIIEKDNLGIDRIVGKRYATIIPYTINISCFAQEHGIAKDLCNRTFNAIIFEAKSLFNDYYRLNITNVAKGGTSLQKTKPNTTYVSSLMLSGTIHWTGEKRPILPEFINNIELLRKVSRNDEDYKKPYNKDEYELISSHSIKK